MMVSGELQKAEGVTHVIAKRVRDCSPWLGDLLVKSRDFR
jgi:error-prone DNA polymerase